MRMVTIWQFVLDYVQKFVSVSCLIRVCLLAELALQILPVKGVYELCLPLLALLMEPLFQALIVNQAHTSTALTRGEQWVRLFVLLAKANSAQCIFRLGLVFSVWMVTWLLNVADVFHFMFVIGNY